MKSFTCKGENGCGGCLSYRECYIDLHSAHPEHIARDRRYKAFISSGIEEVQCVHPSTHALLCKQIERGDNKSSNWVFEGTPIVLIEPYSLEPILRAEENTKLSTRRIPPAISLYCGMFSKNPEDEPWTTSMLIGLAVHFRQVNKLADMLIEISETLPRWNFVEKDND